MERTLIQLRRSPGSLTLAGNHASLPLGHQTASLALGLSSVARAASACILLLLILASCRSKQPLTRESTTLSLSTLAATLTDTTTILTIPLTSIESAACFTQAASAGSLAKPALNHHSTSIYPSAGAATAPALTLITRHAKLQAIEADTTIQVITDQRAEATRHSIPRNIVFNLLLMIVVFSVLLLAICFFIIVKGKKIS